MAALKFPNPAFGDLADRNGIDEVQLFSAIPLPRDEIRLLENRQMLGDCLACHVQPAAKIAEGLAILPVQPIQQPPAARVCQSAKHGVLIHVRHMELFSCLFIGNRSVACQVEKWPRAPVKHAVSSALRIPSVGPIEMTVSLVAVTSSVADT